MQTWLIYALLGGLAANGTTFINRHGLRNGHDPIAYAWWFEFIRTIIFILILPFSYQFHYSPKNLSILVFLGLIEVAAVYSFMKMFAHAQLSMSTLISRLRLIWAPLFAAIFLGEILTNKQYFAILLIFLGAISTSGVKKIKSDQGVRYSFIFAVFAGLLSITMKSATTAGSTPIVFIFMSIPSVLLLPLLMKNAPAKINTSFHKLFKHSLVSTLFNVVSMYLYLEAMRQAQVSLVFSVFNSMAVVAILTGILFLGEKDHLPQKIIGTLLSLFGVLLLT